MARLQDMKREEMFGGKRGAKADAPPKQDPKETQRAIDQLEKDINELKAQYELYFMGIEKLEPIVARDLVVSELRRMQEGSGRNTSQKFKLQQLKARVVSLENYWQRTNRQREAGTYRRDQERVKRRAEEQRKKDAAIALRKSPESEAPPMSGAPTQAVVPATEGRAITGAELRAGRSDALTRPAVPAAGAPPKASADVGRPSATSADDLTEPKLRRLYQTYVTARKRCGEPVDLRYEDMAATLKKQVPKLLSSSGAQSVEFKVVIRSGKAVLKAVPK